MFRRLISRPSPPGMAIVSPPVRRVVLPDARRVSGPGLIPAGELCRPVPAPCGARLAAGGVLGHFPGRDGRCLYGCEARPC